MAKDGLNRPPLPKAPTIKVADAKYAADPYKEGTRRPLHRPPFKAGDLSQDLYLNRGLDPDSPVNKKMIAERTAGRGPIRSLTQRDYADMDRGDRKRRPTAQRAVRSKR